MITKQMAVLGLAFLAILLVGCAVACKNMEDKYVWAPSVSAPKNYPTRVHVSYMKMGDKRMPFGLSFSINTGIGEPSGVIAYDPDAKRPLPDGIGVIWLDVYDKKFYEGNFDFPVDKLQELFSTSFGVRDLIDGKTECYYNTINLTVIPGGRVVLHVCGMGKRVCLDTIYHGTETSIPMSEFTPSGIWKDDPSPKNFIDHYFDDDSDKDKAAFIDKHGVPYDLWDRYMVRYNYDIVFEYESEETTDPNIADYRFTNGEWGKGTDYTPTVLKATPRQFFHNWDVGNMRYDGRFYFDEQEILAAFDNVFGDDTNERGVLRIKVSKYNNLFDIFLEAGERSVKLENTKITVSEETIDPGLDAKWFYRNYEGKKIDGFIAF